MILTEDFEIHIIELPKIEKGEVKGKDKKLKEWLSFLENPESEEVSCYMEKNENMKKAKERLNRMSEDEEMRILAELREKGIRDEQSAKENYYKEGLIEGITKGVEQNNKENAKKMKEKGYNINDIMEITNLTKEEIEEL